MAVFKQKLIKTKQGIDLIIRSPDFKDVQPIVDLVLEVTKDSEDKLLAMSEELKTNIKEQSKWLKKMNESVSDIVFLAEHNSEIIGLLDFTAGHRNRIAHTGEFEMLVKKNFRGNGVGSALLNTLIEWASYSTQIEKINLQVHATNKAAISLYKLNGFDIEGIRLGELKYGENKYIDSLLMAKWVKTLKP